jgi:penicillin amidase
VRTLRLIAALVVLGGGLFVGARPIGPAPALGAFLEPAHGVWSLARAAASPAGPDASVAGLGAPVEVVYDDRAVPHIFARSEEDAYRALGYVVARDRLFQLYVQTVAASGRITEIGGAQALGLDREMRNLGLPRAAEALAARTGDTSVDVRAARAYADGVNAYIAAMPAAELPLEFRLLGKRPPTWEPLHSHLLLGRMGWTLRTSRTSAGAPVRRRRSASPRRTRCFPTIRRSSSRSSRTDRARLASTPRRCRRREPPTARARCSAPPRTSGSLRASSRAPRTTTRRGGRATTGQ